MVIARVGIVKAKDGLLACGGRHPTDALVVPSNAYQMVTLDLAGGVEVFA